MREERGKKKGFYDTVSTHEEDGFLATQIHPSPIRNEMRQNL